MRRLWWQPWWLTLPPVSPWYMYRWLRDWDGRPTKWRAVRSALVCWWTLWHWSATPEGYDVAQQGAPREDDEQRVDAYLETPFEERYALPPRGAASSEPRTQE